MNKYLSHHRETHETSYREYNHKSKKVVNEQRKNREELEKVINNEINYFIQLAKYYYTNTVKESEVEEIEKNEDDLYTLIKDPKDPKKDLLVLIKTDELPEVDESKKENSELKSYINGPLPIFIVPHWIKNTGMKATEFLNNNAILYFFPHKGGKLELRMTEKEREHPIDYNHANIPQYTDSIVNLQNMIFKKILKNNTLFKGFSNDKVFEKFVKKMEDLKTYTPTKLYQRSKDTHEYNQDEEETKIYAIIRECLLYMSEGDNEKLFNLIQAFDIQKEIFTQQK